MFGRFTAALIAIILLTMLPVKNRGITEAKRSENLIRFWLNRYYYDMEDSGRLSLEAVHSLQEKLSECGIRYSLEIEIGTILYYHGESTIEAEYTEEIFEELDSSGEHEIDIRGKMITLCVCPDMNRTEVKLANMFWNSFEPEDRIMIGGYISG